MCPICRSPTGARVLRARSQIQGSGCIGIGATKAGVLCTQDRSGASSSRQDSWLYFGRSIRPPLLSPSTIHAGAKDLINSWSICVRVFRARVWIWVSPEIPIEIGADRQTSATCLGEILRGRTETIGRRP